VRERRFLLKETEGPAGIRGRDSVVPVGEWKGGLDTPMLEAQ
jgi:hypothetical protein